jgi:hypothetical protein
MSFFPFIEGIFYLSLGIIVVLIFLIVFHFKQRIENLEKKGFLLTEVYNNLLKEINIMKTVVYSPPQMQQKQNIVFSTFPTDFEIDPEPEKNTYKRIVVMDKIDEDEYPENKDEDDENEDDENEDDENEDDENEDDENEDDENEDDNTVQLEHNDNNTFELENNDNNTIELELNDLEIKMVIPEIESKENISSSINVTKLDQEPEPKTELDVETETNIISSNNNNTVSYSKLNLQELKMLVISKGLSSNPSKMKRMELLKLLEETI